MEFADMGDAARGLKVLLGPAGSAGDVHPFVPIGQLLKARGHDVTVVTSPYFRNLIERAGLRFEPVGTVEDFEAVKRDPDLWHPWKGFRTLFRCILPMMRECYEAVARLVEPGRTVMAAQWLAFGMRIAAEHLGVPLATVHLQPAAFISAYRFPEPPIHVPEWWPVAVNRLFVRIVRLVGDRMLAPSINGLRAGLGLPAARDIVMGWANSPDRVIGLFPEWFGPPQPDWPSQTRLTGFPLYDEGDVTEASAEVEEFLGAGSPPIIFTPGSAFLHGAAFFEAAAEACLRLGRRGVLLTRNSGQVPGVLPRGVRHFSYVPFGRLLPHCAALVHHGGIGTTAQGLAAGIPQLVMPMAFDQPDNARRLAALGVGRSLPRKRFGGPAVAQALQDLIDSEATAERCRELAGLVRSSEPVEPTCRIIEALGRGYAWNATLC